MDTISYVGGTHYPVEPLHTDLFDYDLPAESIAQHPHIPRDVCRLLVMDRQTGETSHHIFADIIDMLHSGDVLVINETRVLPARLKGQRPDTGGAVETLLLRELESEGDERSGLWECLVKPGKRARVGSLIDYVDTSGEVSMRGEVTAILDDGIRLVRLTVESGSVLDRIHELGEMPLPPYITEKVDDPEMYQTVFGTDEHSAAAPTAGLHFTPELLERIQAKGVRIAKVRLDVGLDTFRPVSEDDPTQHHIHTEFFCVPQETVDIIAQARRSGGRVISVGTTSTRALESAYQAGKGELVAVGAPTALYIMPGYTFGVVDGLITNFHVPRSTLLMLVSAFSDRTHILNAYSEAIESRYRLLSFGDAMFII